MPTQQIPVYRGDPNFDWSPVGLVGEVMIALEEEGWPSVPIATNLFEGPLDLDAYQESVTEVARLFPSSTSTLVAVGPRFRQQLGWRHGTQSLEVEYVDRRSEGLPAGDAAEWLPDVDANCDPIQFDLAVEGPRRIRVTSFSDDWHAIGHIFHHAAGDAVQVVMFDTKVQALYHQKVTGSLPEWAVRDTIHSSRTSTPVADEELESWRSYFAHAREFYSQYPEDEIAQLAGTPGEPGQIVAVHRLGDPKLVAALRDRARSLGATMTDLAMAAAARAIDRWNDSSGVAATAQVHNVLTNIRGRRPPKFTGELANDILGCPIAVQREDRDDRAGLVKAAAAQRKEFFDSGRYVRHLQFTGTVAKAISILPVERRIHVLSLYKRRNTISVSNIGILRSDDRSGRVDSVQQVHRIGGLEACAAVMCGNVPPTIPNLLAMQKTELGTDLGLAGNRAHCTVAELRDVLDLIVAELVEFAA